MLPKRRPDVGNQSNQGPSKGVGNREPYNRAPCGRLDAPHPGHLTEGRPEVDRSQTAKPHRGSDPPSRRYLVESVNRSLRKVSENRGVLPSDNAVRKLFYLAFRNISQKWTRPIANWNGALNRFFILFGDRLPSF